MTTKLMLLPSKRFTGIRLVNIPEQVEEHEAFRHATALIARVEEENPDCDSEEIAEVLEEHGFEFVDFILGPELV